jgi:Na+-driven multidrug efflux pump
VVLKILNSQFIGTGLPHLTMIALIPALIINVVLNILFIPSYKGIGAAMATNISYFSASFVLIFIYSRTFKIGLLEIFRYRKNDFAFLQNIRLRRQ